METWEAQIHNIITKELQCSYGDAEAIMRAEEFLLMQLWAKGEDAYFAAQKIIYNGNQKN